MKRKPCFLMTIFLLLALLSGCAETAEPLPDSTEAITLLSVNVGKADCHLLSYSGVNYLIDTGSEESWGAVSAALHLMGISRLDGVVLTHTDGDHSGGAEILAASGISVDHWYAPEYYTGCKPSKHPAVKAAALCGQQVEWLSAGQELPLSDGVLRVLGPCSQNEEAENCNSAVLLAEADCGSILLTGDMEFPEEQELLTAGVLSPCTVLKIGNHGENDATSEAFLEAVSPALAIISTSTEEEPDTPAPRVISLLKQMGTEYIVTQSAELGILTELSGGTASYRLLMDDILPQMEIEAELTEKDNEADIVTISNSSENAADLSGCYILSGKGGEIFVFPPDTILPAGESLTVGTLSSPEECDFIWQDKNVWHNKKQDTAFLYDPYGRLLSELE